MPYFITDTSPDCDGWATIKDDGEVIGCHDTKQAAIDQMVAVSIAEGMEPGGERNLDGPPAIIVDIGMTLLDENDEPIENVVRFVDEYEGEVLIVGLNSDASVRRLKGPERPIRTAAERAVVLAAFEAVDAVVVFEEDTPLALVERLQPDVIVKGGDYAPDTIVGADVVTRRGGRVTVVPLVPDQSTTAIIGKLRSAHDG